MANLRISIIHPTGGKKTQVEVPNNIAAQKLISALVPRLGFPQVGPNGRPVSYTLVCPRSGEETVVAPEQTLSDAGVEENDVLRLVADMQAGNDG